MCPEVISCRLKPSAVVKAVFSLSFGSAEIYHYLVFKIWCREPAWTCSHRDDTQALVLLMRTPLVSGDLVLYFSYETVNETQGMCKIWIYQCVRTNLKETLGACFHIIPFHKLVFGFFLCQSVLDPLPHILQLWLFLLLVLSRNGQQMKRRQFLFQTHKNCTR